MSTDLALTRPEPLMDHQSLKTMMDQAVRYVESGLLPNTIKTPQQALIVMAQGRELGIPPTVALRGIVVVQGKPTCSAELMMALVHRAYGQSAMRVYRTDNESCTIQYRQQGWDGVSEYTFSMEDAKRAGLLKNPTWNAYPAAMLRARAISATVRFAFPEVISGVYTPDEAGADFKVVDGEVVPSDEAPPVPDTFSHESCDADYFNKAWHAAVKGTRFAQDDIRHKFIGLHTKGATESLSTYLESATADDAEFLIETITRRIAAEAKRAAQVRIDLEADLRDAVKTINDLGGSMDVPENLAELPDDEIRAIVGNARATIEIARDMQDTGPDAL